MNHLCNLSSGSNTSVAFSCIFGTLRFLYKEVDMENLICTADICTLHDYAVSPVFCEYQYRQNKKEKISQKNMEVTDKLAKSIEKAVKLLTTQRQADSQRQGFRPQYKPKPYVPKEPVPKITRRAIDDFV